MFTSLYGAADAKLGHFTERSFPTRILEMDGDNSMDENETSHILAIGLPLVLLAYAIAQVSVCLFYRRVRTNWKRVKMEQLQRTQDANCLRTNALFTGGKNDGSVFSHLEVGNTLGIGAFGRVFLAKNKVTGTLLAVKETIIDIRPTPTSRSTRGSRSSMISNPLVDSINNSRSTTHRSDAALRPTNRLDDVDLENYDGSLRRTRRDGGTDDQIQEQYVDALQEIKLLQILQHPNIVLYIGHEIIRDAPTRLLIFLEYLPGGTIKSQLDEFGAFSDSLVQRYSKQMFSGISYLHNLEQPVLHRDLKPANLLLTLDGELKIADFGTGKLKHVISPGQFTASHSGTITGTMQYMAPEVYSGKEMGCSQDIWSAGCCILEMCTAERPWVGFELENVMDAFRVIACSDALPARPTNRPPKLLDLIYSCCLNRDARTRGLAIDMLNHHPFLTDETANWDEMPEKPISESSTSSRQSTAEGASRETAASRRHLRSLLENRRKSTPLETITESGAAGAAAATACEAVEKSPPPLTTQISDDSGAYTESTSCSLPPSPSHLEP